MLSTALVALSALTVIVSGVGAAPEVQLEVAVEDGVIVIVQVALASNVVPQVDEANVPVGQEG